MSIRIAGALSALVLAAACSQSDSGPDGGPQAYDENCHYDCFAYHSCSDGVVTSVVHRPVRCQDWTGACPTTTYQCARGCRTDGFDTRALEPRDLCEEARPKEAGDPCTAPEHCEPQVATEGPDGGIVNVYLRCDVRVGECVAREAPSVPDYLEPKCGLSLDSSPGYAFGVAEVAACSGGVCSFLETDSCVLQGCTVRCDSDDDCPSGSRCCGVCKPGSCGSVEVGLRCP